MTQEQPLLSCTNLTAPSFTPTSAPLWTNVTLSLPPSSILALRGPSGCGKTVLLKSLAHLLVYPTDTTPPPRITLSGKTPNEVGIPRWRAKVLYLPQRAALLPGTPNEFFGTLCGVASRKGEEEQKRIGDPKRIANEWGIGEGLWEQKWGELSGGEAQRIALAVALALKPDVLLLDEPTSALDNNTAALVEETLLRKDEQGRKQACIWITHSDEQAKRVADATLDLTPFLTSRGATEREQEEV